LTALKDGSNERFAHRTGVGLASIWGRIIGVQIAKVGRLSAGSLIFLELIARNETPALRSGLLFAQILGRKKATQGGFIGLSRKPLALAMGNVELL
jgi:hypothetical protein